VSEKIIHFGEFIRWKRVTSGKTTEAMGREVGLTSRRLIAIEAMATPEIQHTTMASFARAFGIDPEQFDSVWRSTPVPVTRRKAGPTTDEAKRFAAACAAAGTTQAEGLRRLRSWLVEQDKATQLAALSFIPAHRQQTDSEAFTDAVDHLQDPAEAVQKRAGEKAAQQAKSQESAATGESTHH
jgi:transcriptional regulator with XRE-family HTH domain